MNTTLTEKLNKNQSASVWIRDFIDSTNPKFEGKTKKERIAMALGAYYAAQKNEEYGAGFEGTDELRKKYIQDTPGQKIQQFKTTMNQQTYKTYQEFATHHQKMYPTHTMDQVKVAWETYSKAFEMEEAVSIGFIDDLIDAADKEQLKNKQLRQGQSIMIALKNMSHGPFSKLYSDVTGTEYDPFYNDKKIPALMKYLNPKWTFSGVDEAKDHDESRTPKKGTYDLKEEKESYDSWIIKPREGPGDGVKVQAPDETSAIEIALGRKPSQNEIDFFNFHYILIHEKTNVSTLRHMKIVELATKCYDSDLVKEFVEQQYKPQTSVLEIKESFRSFISKQKI